MASILNCLDEEQTLKVGGNFYTLKGGQLKYFHDQGIARLFAQLHKHNGIILAGDELDHLAALKPDQFEKLATDEDRELINKYKCEGVENYCRHLRELIYNATVSLQKDLDRAGYKYDARVEATSADLHRFRQLAKYQKTKSDLDQRRIDEIRELEKQIGPVTKG